MSGEWTGLTWDELDRLADYTAGALTGAEADEVARLIATDDRWAAAHAELLAAEPAVTAALRTAAAPAVSMPADIAARLDAALADAARAGTRSTDVARSDRPPAVRRGRPHPVRPGRRTRWAPVVLRVAAGVIALAAVGGVATAVLRSGVIGVPTTALDAGEEAMAENEPSAEAYITTDADPQYLASGTDYTIDSLPDLITAVPPAAPNPMNGRDVDLNRLTVDGSLTDVASPEGLARCLAAVQQAYPGVVMIVDFARFEGKPAVVIAMQDGERWTVVAVGAQCGPDGLAEFAAVSVE
jgi:hypothetical protein